MTRLAYLGIDVGTSGCKAVVIDDRGRVRGTSWATYPTRRHLDGEVTQAAADWLRAVRSTIRGCVVSLGDDQAIAGLSITAPAHVGVLVDRDGEPLARSLLAFDARPSAVAQELRARFGDSLFERTFVDLSAAWTFPQLAWVRQQHPEIWPRIHTFLTQKDYIRFRLTGRAAIDPTDAAGTAMFDPRAGRWIDDVRAELGLAAAVLPEIRPSSTIGGGLTATWARLTGLRAGTPVAIGATDTAAELISVGATSAGSSLIKIASTGTVVAVSDRPVVDRRVLTYPHAVADRWYTLAATNTAATAYGWLRDTVFASDPEPPAAVYREMDRMASRVPAGAGDLLFLPFLEGERTPYWDRDLRAAFLGLSSAHRREHLCRAVLEGVALSLRTCADTIESLGLDLAQPTLGGGGAGSRLWRTILVSALGRSAVMHSSQGPAIGAAMLVGSALGDERAMNPHRRWTRVEPRADWQATYARLHETYRDAVTALGPVSHALSRSQMRAATVASGRVIPSA